MPIHPTFRNNPALQNPPDHEQVRAVFRIGLRKLRRLQTVLPATDPHGGYPDLLLFAVAVTSRIYGSQRKALRELAAPGVWEQATDLYQQALGVTDCLPEIPPPAHVMDRFVARIAPPDPPAHHDNPEAPPEPQVPASPSDGRKRQKDEGEERDLDEILRALSDAFTASAVAMAKRYGQFPETLKPDFSRPNPRNLILGDGTWYKPFSKVSVEKDPSAGKPIVTKSRSRLGRPRIQHKHTDGRLENKHGLGINHVTVSTWSEYGWIVLAVGQALGAEVNEARRLVDRVSDLLPLRIHTLVWDGAVNGHHVGDLMRERRILVVNKNAAKGMNKSGHARQPISDDDAIAAFNEGAPLPLGTSVYRTSKGPNIVHGYFHHLGNYDFEGCTHALWVDDGALVDVLTGDHGERMKVHHATAVTSRAQNVSVFRDDDKDYKPRWELHTEWELPCTGTTHTFTTSKRAHGRPKKQKKESVTALTNLRPIPRIDPTRFPDVYGLRNNSESINAWFKARLGTTAKRGRAMRLHRRAQFFDHLCAAGLANTLTAYRHYVITGRL